MQQTKFIIVSGGVLSGLGKGITAASIGKLLSTQYRVIPMKLDGYLNVDPGTMNPIEHGEVFVLDDGGEVDMDFGHYERFLNVTCKSSWGLTMGKVFDEIRKKERRGDYLGQTVEYIPHVVDHIRETIQRMAQEEQAEIFIIEVGGTVGQIENDLYFEAMRQLRRAVGHENTLFVHLTYIPILDAVHEQKSKPTQQSVALLRERGIQPDVVIGRCKEPITDNIKRKIGIFCDVEPEAVITGLDVDNVYKIPLVFEKEGLTQVLSTKLGIAVQPDLGRLRTLLAVTPTTKLTLAICGKYTALEDSYASVIEALRHAAANVNVLVELRWIETTHIENHLISVEEALKDIHGVIVPGGFGARGAEGKIEVIRFCRENNIPYLGLCYGMQLAVIEYARTVCGLRDANSSEINPNTPHPVVDLLPGQEQVTEKGASMRLGGHNVHIAQNTTAHTLFGNITRLRFRHRYEVHPQYVETLASQGLVFSGTDPSGAIMQIMELPKHPFFMATQAHPELTSKLEHPSPFFVSLLEAAKRESGRQRLIGHLVMQ